jgi:hypothetical protein
MTRNLKKLKGTDGNENLINSKENGIENDNNNHDDDKEYMSENDHNEMNHKLNNKEKENNDNDDNTDKNNVKTQSKSLELNNIVETPQKIDTQGI